VNKPTNGTVQHPPRHDGAPGVPPTPKAKPDPKTAPEAKERPPQRPNPGAHAEEKGFPFWPIVIGAAVVIGIIALVLIPRLHQKSELKTSTDEMSVPTVTILHPKTGPGQVTLTLPGNVQAFYDSPIFARTDGYLKKWYVDIGGAVKEGQLLAEIDSPEVDQQLIQAQASRDQATANLNLSRTTAVRWEGLLKTNAVSQQEVDEKEGDLAARQADFANADANVRRLENLQSFEKVVAPFDGIVTQRNTDIGNLINAGASGPGQQLFRVAQIGTLRVYVQVPEAYSASITPGTEAQIALASSPGQPATGKVVSTAGSIDPGSRTLMTEIQVPNPDDKLMPGGYAQVHFDIVLPHPPLVIPANTLLFRTAGSQVGIVDADHTVQLKKVQIGRDFGTTVEITDGITADDSVILNPSDSLTAGTKVNVKEQAPPPAAAGAPGGTSGGTGGASSSSSGSTNPSASK